VDCKSLQHSRVKMQTSLPLPQSDMQTNQTPMVSVIIPAYNTAAFIAETLDSVFSQTFTEFEVILINDGSPDTSKLEQVLAPYRERIIYLKQDNRGPGAARNLGIRYARSEYIAFLDGDDSWLPEYLAVQMKLFEETPSLDLIYLDAQLIGDPSVAGKTFMELCPSVGPATFESLLLQHCSVITSCTIGRKQALVDAGLFDEGANICGSEDYDLWLRVAFRGGEVAYQRKVLGRYRRHPQSLSAPGGRGFGRAIEVMNKVAKTLPLTPEMSAALQKHLERVEAYYALEQGKMLLSAGKLLQAKKVLEKANSYFHSRKLRLILFGLRVAPRPTFLGMRIYTELSSRRIA
jgi:glycosyltransferase involved in cell wall biosynthesis